MTFADLGENRRPDKDFLKSLTSGPELQNSLVYEPR